MYPKQFRYTKDHEWVHVDGDRGRYGVTAYAGDNLGDVVFVELPAEGQAVSQGDPFAVVESVKAVADCYAPLSGTVVEVNTKLEDEPGLINEDPHGEGWICVIEPTDLSELENLMDVETYEKFAAEEGGA